MTQGLSDVMRYGVFLYPVLFFPYVVSIHSLQGWASGLPATMAGGLPSSNGTVRGPSTGIAPQHRPSCLSKHRPRVPDCYSLLHCYFLRIEAFPPGGQKKGSRKSLWELMRLSRFRRARQLQDSHCLSPRHQQKIASREGQPGGAACKWSREPQMAAFTCDSNLAASSVLGREFG